MKDIVNVNLDAEETSELRRLADGFELLATYARLKASAQEHRIAGNIAIALMLESDCDKVYKRLPEDFKSW
jgi:hypothetical protein